MLKPNLTLTSLFLAVFSVYGQENKESLSAWVNSHPSVVIMDESDYSSLSEEKKILLGEEIILFNGELTPDDIQKYESKQTDSSTSRSLISEEYASEIKTWLYYHPDVKIIHKDQYDSLSAEDQEKYNSHGVVIVEGKALTIEDIENYEAQH
ncbi:MAG: hypothetical protein HWE22_00520 [Flavobacteriales bacterium]|nr:hypothetical protein [Flavobacteriales bacterium]